MNRRQVMLGGLLANTLPCAAAANVCNKFNKAHYDGSLKFEREYPSYFRLTAPYAFIDGCGKRWQAPIGTVTDGASIPRVAQVFIGDPYSGGYLDAAVIHDWFCATRLEPHDDVHRMFYNAMLASGVGDTLARIMYTAVCWRGPKWDLATMMNSRNLFSRDPRSFIQPHAPMPPPPAPRPDPPPRPPHAPPLAPPDAGLLEAAKTAMASNDAALAQVSLAQYEAQSSAYNTYVASEVSRTRAESDELRARAESERVLLEKERENDRKKKLEIERIARIDEERFRELINRTDGKSLNDIAMIAEKYVAATSP